MCVCLYVCVRVGLCLHPLFISFLGKKAFIWRPNLVRGGGGGGGGGGWWVGGPTIALQTPAHIIDSIPH